MIHGSLTAPSGGSGGPLADAKEVWFESSNGYGSYYHRYTSHVDWIRPVGIMFWFHGDGGYEFENPDDPYYLAGPNGVVAKARAANAILIVPGTPDDGALRGGTWWKWGTKDSNPRYVKELFTHITSQYNVDMYRVWLCGFSGGAEFLTLYLLRHWGNEMGIRGGGCLMIGGGTKPPVDADFPADYKDHWVWEWRVGALDTGKNSDGTTAGDGFNAVNAAKGSEQWFRERGWKTTLDIVPGKGHLMPRFYGELVQRTLRGNPPPRGMVPPQEIFYRDREIKEAWFRGERIYSGKPVETIPAGLSGFGARDWFRTKLTEYGKDYTRVTDVPFDIDASKTTDLYSLFQGCSSLVSTPSMDTSHVTGMSQLFSGCRSLALVTPMDTRNVTDMSFMFFDCKSLMSVPSMDTSRVESIDSMFSQCLSLTSIPKMDTSRVNSAKYVFWSCRNIIRIPDMPASGIADATGMFEKCAKLTDGNVRLIGKKRNVVIADMIKESGLTREPFYDDQGNPI